jgi:hypothetical protein
MAQLALKELRPNNVGPQIGMLYVSHAPRYYWA